MPLESKQPKREQGPKQDELPGVTPERKPSLESDGTYFVRDAGTQTPFSFPPHVVVVANGAHLTTHSI